MPHEIGELAHTSERNHQAVKDVRVFTDMRIPNTLSVQQGKYHALHNKYDLAMKTQ